MSASAHSTTLPLHRLLLNFFFGKLGRASSWLFVGGIAGGMLGYVFQILMGRMLSTQEYGLFSAIMALAAMFSAPLSTLLMVISRRVSEYRAKQDKGSITHLYNSINIRAAVVIAVILCSSYFIAPQIQTYLKAPNPIPIFLLGLILFFTSPTIINNAFLQGIQNFTWLSASGTLGILFKIGFTVLLVWLGYGIAGALGGIILAAIFGCPAVAGSVRE